MIYIYGGGLLAYTTAVCVALWGHHVTQVGAFGLHTLDEPGLAEQLKRVEAEKMYRAYMGWTLPDDAYKDGDIIWLCYDTPIAKNTGDISWVTNKVNEAIQHAATGTCVLISSQVPVGYSASLQYLYPDLTFLSIPENIRRGSALRDFTSIIPVIGAPQAFPDQERQRISRIFAPFESCILWTSPATAEMSKHVLNSYLATCIAFGNDMSEASARFGANYDEILQIIRRDPRVAPTAPLRSGKADGKHLLRDINYLEDHGFISRLLQAVRISHVWVH